MKRQFMWRSVAVLGFVLAIGGTVWANGEGFFAPADAGPVDLVYVGHVREKATGRLIKSPAFITVTDNYSGLSFPFTNDTAGHFRSPDIGLALKEEFGPAKSETLEARVVVSGYQTVEIKKMPRRDKGVVELNVQMVPDGTPTDPQDSSSAPLDSTGGPQGDFNGLWVALGAAVVIAGAGARTLVHRRSIANSDRVEA